MRAAASSVIRVCGPEVEMASEPGASGHRHREAAHADLLLALVDGVSLLADHLEVGDQQVRVGDRGGRVGGHAVPLEQRARLAGRKLGEQGLADRGAVRLDPAAWFGEHPHRVRAGHLGDVDDLVAVEHGQVGRLAGEPDQLGQERPQPGAEHLAGGLAEPDQPRAQRVPPRGLLPDVAPVDQRAHQPVHGGQREARRRWRARRGRARRRRRPASRAGRRPARWTARRPPLPLRRGRCRWNRRQS